MTCHQLPLHMVVSMQYHPKRNKTCSLATHFFMLYLNLNVQEFHRRHRSYFKYYEETDDLSVIYNLYQYTEFAPMGIPKGNIQVSGKFNTENEKFSSCNKLKKHPAVKTFNSKNNCLIPLHLFSYVLRILFAYMHQTACYLMIMTL